VWTDVEGGQSADDQQPLEPSTHWRHSHSCSQGHQQPHHSAPADATGLDDGIHMVVMKMGRGWWWWWRCWRSGMKLMMIS